MRNLITLLLLCFSCCYLQAQNFTLELGAGIGGSDGITASLGSNGLQPLLAGNAFTQVHYDLSPKFSVYLGASVNTFGYRAPIISNPILGTDLEIINQKKTVSVPVGIRYKMNRFFVGGAVLPSIVFEGAHTIKGVDKDGTLFKEVYITPNPPNTVRWISQVDFGYAIPLLPQAKNHPSLIVKSSFSYLFPFKEYENSGSISFAQLSVSAGLQFPL